MHIHISAWWHVFLHGCIVSRLHKCCKVYKCGNLRTPFLYLNICWWMKSITIDVLFRLSLWAFFVDVLYRFLWTKSTLSPCLFKTVKWIVLFYIQTNKFAWWFFLNPESYSFTDMDPYLFFFVKFFMIDIQLVFHSFQISTFHGITFL